MTIDQARRRQAFARWHRRLALAVFAWLAALAATGILINHAHDWGLDSKPLPGWLTERAYGVTAVDGDQCPRGIPSPSLCAAVFAWLDLPSGELLLTPDAVLLVGQEGELIESLSVAQVGLSRVEAAYLDESSVYLKGGGRAVRSDLDLITWQPLAPDTQREMTDARWRERGDGPGMITWERLLLDLHAARFLGPMTALFTDLMAGLILFLAGSGIWLWWLKRQRARSS
ncbi:MAG: PepSY domain-containing protein [Lysobacterales bacterium]